MSIAFVRGLNANVRYWLFRNVRTPICGQTLLLSGIRKRRRTASVTKVLEIEATRKSVSGVAGVRAATCARPIPAVHTIPARSAMTAAIPGLRVQDSRPPWGERGGGGPAGRGVRRGGRVRRVHAAAGSDPPVGRKPAGQRRHRRAGRSGADVGGSSAGVASQPAAVASAAAVSRRAPSVAHEGARRAAT